MPDSLHHSISFLIAQTTPGASTTTAGTSPVVFWSAILLVAAGLAILGIAGANWLRSRRSEESGVATDYEPTPIPARSAPMPVAAMPERTERLPASRTAQPSPSTMEAQNLLRLMGEAEELCTRLGRELDDKAQRIERLLARAEGRLGSDFAPASEHPTAPTPRTPAHTPTPRPEIVTRPVAVPAPTPFAFTGPSPYYNSAPTATQPMPQHVQTRIAAPVVSPPAPTPTPQPASLGIDALTRDIYTLADAGHSATAIAQQLGQHTGKVELILALRPG